MIVLIVEDREGEKIDGTLLKDVVSIFVEHDVC